MVTKEESKKNQKEIAEKVVKEYMKIYEKRMNTPIKKQEIVKKEPSKEEYFDIILEQDVIITKESFYRVKAKNVKEAGEKVLYDYSGDDPDVEEISISYLEDTEDYFSREERPNCFRIINPEAKGKKRILYQE